MTQDQYLRQIFRRRQQREAVAKANKAFGGSKERLEALYKEDDIVNALDDESVSPKEFADILSKYLGEE